MGAEDAVASMLSAALPCPVYREVPADRPAAFATVERTGGHFDGLTDAAALSVRLWGATRREAMVLAEAAARALSDAPESVPGCFGSTVASSHNDPDLDGRTPRYQVVCEIEYQG